MHNRSCFFLSIASSTASVVCTRDVSVEWNCLFPLCVDDNRLFDSRYGTNWFKAIRSHTLDKIGNSDIGRLFSGFSWYPCLNIGVTSAVFQINGNVPDVNEALIIVVNVGAIDDKQQFNILTVILSFPGALPEGIELITLSISLHPTSLNENCCVCV